MRKLLRHDIFHYGLLAGIFATLTVILFVGVILLLTAPWVVPIGQAPPSAQQIGMLRWDQQGFPIKVSVGTTITSTALSLSDVTFDGYSLWVTGSISESKSGALFQVDPRTLKTEKVIDVGSDPRGVLFDGQHIWVASRGDGAVYCIAKPGEEPIKRREEAGSSPYYLAFDGKYVWVTARDKNELWRLAARDCQTDDDDLTVLAEKLNAPFGIIFDGTYIWVANRGSNEVMRLDPDKCTAQECEPRTVKVGAQGSQPSNLAYDGKYVWVTLQGTDQVARIDAETVRVVGQLISVGRNPWGIAYDGANIWVANNWDESVSRLRAADGALLDTFATGGAASRFAFDGTFIWVTNYSSDDKDSSFLTRR